MGKRKYRTVVAAVLAGAVLFSPLLCGMTCLGTRGGNSNTGVVVAPAMELAGESVVSRVVGCVLTQVILSIDGGEWAELARVGSWFWVGLEIVRFVEGR
jgi:hypothetical protein